MSDPLARVLRGTNYVPFAEAEDAADILQRRLRADGYLLVSEAELAEALSDAIPELHRWLTGGWKDTMRTDAVKPAAAIFAALVKQQEGRER